MDKRFPEEGETLDGRVPALDSDGYLVQAYLLDGELLCSSDLPATHWLEVPPRPVVPPTN